MRSVTRARSASRSGASAAGRCRAPSTSVQCTDVGLQRPAEAAHLHVVRHHHHDVVAGLDQVHQRDEFASEPPLVTCTCAGVAPGYIDAIDVRSSTVPFVCGYPSGCAISACRSPSVSTSSSTRSGWTPLSARFQATLCSQIDWSRSSAKASKLHSKKCTSRARTGCSVHLGYPVASAWTRRLSARICSFPSWRPSRRVPSPWAATMATRTSGRRTSFDLAAFQIGVQPVTNEEYARFVRESGHRAPAVHALPLVVTAGSGEREDVFRRTERALRLARRQPPRERLDHPVTLVHWDDAVAYCAWLSTVTRPRVPSSHRGGMGEGLPRRPARPALSVGRALRSGHGEVPRGTGATARKHGTTPCRAYPPNGYGVFDIVGNVWEWVQDWYAPDAYCGAAALEPGRARERDVCGSSAAAAGCRPTSACCGAATATRCRPTPTRTRSAFASLRPSEMPRRGPIWKAGALS